MQNNMSCIGSSEPPWQSCNTCSPGAEPEVMSMGGVEAPSCACSPGSWHLKSMAHAGGAGSVMVQRGSGSWYYHPVPGQTVVLLCHLFFKVRLSVSAASGSGNMRIWWLFCVIVYQDVESCKLETE